MMPIVFGSERDTNRLTCRQARALMRTGAVPGYACESCPPENFWECNVWISEHEQWEKRIVCHPSQVIPATQTLNERTKSQGPYR